jgi:hypothetical protein
MRLNFVEAWKALKDDGKCVSRDGWNGKQFVFMQVPATIHKDVVPKMQSLPQSAKDIFQKRFDDPAQQIDAIYYNNQFAIVGPSNMVCGWVPSATDLLETDWFIVE